MFLTAVVAGTLVEVVAAWLDLWRYSPGYVVVLNIALFFGGAMTAVAAMLRSCHPLWSLLAGSLLGYGYEWLNLLGLHWWQFPEGKLFCLRGDHWIAGGLALGWGIVPLVLRVLWRK